MLNLMADSALDPQLQSAKLCLRNIFNIPGFFIGLSSRSSLDSDAVWSPTSPLDFSFFSTLSNPFSLKSPKSSQISHQKKWEVSKVGLGIINLLADETEPTGDDDIDSLERKNIIFGPQVKACRNVRSKSLPKNFTIPTSGKIKSPNLSVLGSKQFENSSTISLIQSTNLSSLDLCSENRRVVASSPLLIASDLKVENSLYARSTSLPIPIESSHGNVGSLSAREIQLSEDYTCIISHGPIPKTTHIFGDCILECPTQNFSTSESRDNLANALTEGAIHHEVSATDPCNEFLCCCSSCKNTVEKGDNIHLYLGEEAFYNFDRLRGADILSEEVADNNCNDFCRSSPNSSCNEGLFLIGMPINT